MGVILLSDKVYQRVAKNLYFFQEQYYLRRWFDYDLDNIWSFVEDLRELNYQTFGKNPPRLERIFIYPVGLDILIEDLLSIQYQLSDYDNDIIKKLNDIIFSLLISFFYERRNKELIAIAEK